MRYNLFVLDVDGTLVGESGVVRPRVVDAVRRASVAGAALAICTGRPLAACRPLIAGLALVGPQIVFSGALVRDLAATDTVLKTPLSVEAVRRIVAFGRERDVCLELYTEERHVVEREWDESRRHALSVRVDYSLGDFDALAGEQELIKAQIIVSETRTPWLVGELTSHLGDIVEFSVATPMAPCEGLKCINVVSRGVSKGHAVRALAHFYGLEPHQVVGIGDAPNDLDMFAAVGWRVAMGNADPSIRDIADMVCPGVEDDGVAVALDALTAP